jgi:hypothetical protein
MTEAVRDHPSRELQLNGVNTTVAGGCLYLVNSRYGYALYEYLAGAINGTCDWDDRQHTGQSLTRNNVWCSGTSSLSANWWLGALYNRGNATVDSITRNIDNLATAVTNHMRAVGVDWDGMNETAADSGTLPPSFTTGTAHQPSVCTHFDWEWLLFPAILLLIAMIFLGLIVVQTVFYNPDRVPIWKSSTLPLFLGGRNADFELIEGGRQSIRDIENRSKHTMMQFSSGGQGWVFGPASKGRA